MEVFWLCDDCLFAAAYDDCSALSLRHQEKDDARIAAIQHGLSRLMPLSADFDAEAGWGIEPFSRSSCDACGSPLQGQRHRFTRL
jgi:hypothetical protein